MSDYVNNDFFCAFIYRLDVVKQCDSDIIEFCVVIDFFSTLAFYFYFR
jgi:hypothetical protein